MDSFARFLEVDAALDVALEIPREERAEHLLWLRSLDEWVAVRVERLLELAEGSDAVVSPGGALAGPFGEALSNALVDGDPVPLGWVGNYRIVREIARGGMSVVYLAARAGADFEQVAAVKVMKRGFDTDELLRRFSQERRILASLDHPAIARLFDGGATDDGRPYIVMEYVAGTSIGRYCVERGLGLSERLRLFLDVARAVEYAHRHLVVHRDLKPGNVLVSDDGRVKLLDFGIAKLLDDSGDGVHTQAAQRLMTPEYASPEQRLGGPITTASDVYQLGLLLYELTTGRRPDAADGALEAAMPRLTSAGARASRNNSRVDRDLSSVISMALQADPAQRYASAAQFADDVERYLTSAPVLARRPTTAYRMRKFVKRHPAAVTTAAAFLVATVAYATVLTKQARALAEARTRAEASADTASQVAGFMVDVFALANPAKGERANVTARELLDAGASRLESELRDQPELLAEMLRAAGKSYFGLGLNAEAERLLRRSVDLLRPLPTASHALARSINDLGLLRHEQGQASEARTLLTEALMVRRSIYGVEHPEVAESLHGLGRVEAAAGDHAAAERLFRDALSMRERMLGRDDVDTARTLQGLGNALRAAGRLEEAEPPLREAMRIREAALGVEHPDTTDSLNAVALLLRDRGNAADAEPLLRRALDANRRRLGSRHPYVATNMNNLALILRDLGHHDRAEPLYREALEILRTAYGREHPRVAIALFNLGTVLQDLRQYGEAEPLFREALAIDRKMLGDAHQEVAVDRIHLGHLLYLQGKIEDAERLLRPALTDLRQTTTPRHPRVARGALTLGSLLVDSGRAIEAEPLLLEAAAIYRETYGEDDPRTLSARLTLGRATSALGRFTDVGAPTAARCRTIGGRYREEVARALAKLLSALETTPQAPLIGAIAAGTICGEQPVR